MEPRNRFQVMNSASLCSLAGRYDNTIPTRFLVPIDCLKILAQASNSAARKGTKTRDFSEGLQLIFIPRHNIKSRSSLNLTCWLDCWNQDPRTLGWWRNCWDDCDRFRSWKFVKLVRDFRKKVQFAERKVEVRTCCSCLEMLHLFHP
jgi:hypothetical protein